MTVIVNEVRKGTYLDSVALMRMGLEIRRIEGVEEAGLMVGTPANRDILRAAGVLDGHGEQAGSGDLIIAVRATSAQAAAAAMGAAKRLFDARRGGDAPADRAWQPRSLRSGLEALPDANLVLISVPGDFAAAEALKALQRGLNVMIFSDNVPLADEVELKRMARDRGLLVMGPDCGTAIIGGVPLAFANAVPPGDIGIIGASGTGIQEVSCLIARAGRGISHAIGTGGRDLKAEVGGITTLAAMDLLDADPATKHIVIISKPPADVVAQAVIQRAGQSPKPVVLCFLGSPPCRHAVNIQQVATLEAAAIAALGAAGNMLPAGEPRRLAPSTARTGVVCGLFSGGTLCAEAQVEMQALGLVVRSNAPIAGGEIVDPGTGDMCAAHTLIDLGDDHFTRGRPHPMIEPAVRDRALIEACSDPRVRVVLLDVVLGYGGHPDPAGHVASVVDKLSPRRPVIVASVTGTEQDRQVYSRQVAKLEAAGIEVWSSAAAAARRAAHLTMSEGSEVSEGISRASS